MDRQDSGLVTGEQVIDKVANNRVRFISEFSDDATNQGAAAAMPFQIDCAVKIAAAMNLCPTMWPSRLLRPDLDELEFLFQLRIAHNF